MGNAIWLSVSLFCFKNSWNFILNEGIIPFLDKLSVENKRPSFLIGFNHSGGENIRFSISVHESDANSVAEEIDTYFKKILSRAVAAKKEDILPGIVTELFMPFSENTIQYGLYSPVRNDGEARLTILAIVLSTIMLDALKEEDINDNGIGTFALYLTISVLNVIGKNAYASEKGILDFYKGTARGKTGDGHLEFIKNRECLVEIAHAIIYKKDTGEWLSSWEVSLRKTIRKVTNTKELLHIHDLVISMIFKQLDITDQRKLTLHYFIDQLMLTDLKNEVFKSH